MRRQRFWIPLAVLDQQRVIAAIGAAHFRARVTLQMVLFHGRKESRRAVDAIAVEQRFFAAGMPSFAAVSA